MLQLHINHEYHHFHCFILFRILITQKNKCPYCDSINEQHTESRHTELQMMKPYREEARRQMDVQDHHVRTVHRTP